MLPGVNLLARSQKPSAVSSRDLVLAELADGSLSRLDEERPERFLHIRPVATHARCRCSPAPRTMGWEAILGPAKFGAYKAGAIKLADVAGFRTDPKVGAGGIRDGLG